MAQEFSEEAIQRIGEAVRAYERHAPWNGPKLPIGRTYENHDDLIICKLTQALVVGGTANAHPWIWSAASGSYSADTSATVKVTDTLNAFSAAVDCLVLCRFIGKEDGSWLREVLYVFPPCCSCEGSGGSSIGNGGSSIGDDGYPPPPGGCTPQWVMDDVSGCYVLVCCPGSGGSGGSGDSGDSDGSGSGGNGGSGGNCCDLGTSPITITDSGGSVPPTSLTTSDGVSWSGSSSGINAIFTYGLACNSDGTWTLTVVVSDEGAGSGSASPSNCSPFDLSINVLIEGIFKTFTMTL